MGTSSNSYVARLKLDFDPFGIKSASKDFFPGGGRQALLEQLASIARTPGSILVVTGELGIGKSTLAQALAKQLGKEAVCAHVQATLFMNQDQFLELLLAELDLSAAETSSPLDALSAYANDLALSARSLVLVIDDAQELASDVHAAIAKLMRRNSGGGFSVILLGEAQLQGLLERGLPAALSQQVEYCEFPLFSREDSEEYARFKLARAGFRKPLPLGGGELGNAHNASTGIPGKLNAQLVSALNRAVEAAAPVPTATAGDGNSVLQLGKSYWLAAGTLVVALLVVALWPSVQPDSPNVVGGQAIPVQVGSANQSPTTAAPDAAPVEAQALSVRNPVPAPTGSTRQQSNAAASAPQSAVVAAPAEQSSRSTVSAGQVSTTTTEPTAVAPQLPNTSQLTAFERSLLAAAPDSYTVQILGSRSVDSIRRFLAEHGNLAGSGYFETRYQGQPWYVVVAGSFSQRGNAEAAIEGMPADVRQLQPWVRSMRDIQSGLRDLHQLP